MATSNPLTPTTDPLAASFATTYAGVVAFIAVVSEGSFARAADRLGVGRSAVSRNVQKLEEQLNVRLLRRTTRSTTLTREGDLFYASCHPGVDRIVQAVEEMRDLRSGPPRGHLRVGASCGFGRLVVAPLLNEYRAEFPEVSVDLLLGDSATDFTTDHVDVAFRSGRMEDSQTIARKIIPMQMVVCGSRKYVQKHGLPSTVDELSDHECINFRTGSGRILEWEFDVDDRRRKFTPRGQLTHNDPELVLQAVLDGQGIAQLPSYLACDALRSGALVPCLSEFATDDLGHFICYQSRQHMPTRMRTFIDFMIARIRDLDLDYPMGVAPELDAVAA